MIRRLGHAQRLLRCHPPVRKFTGRDLSALLENSTTIPAHIQTLLTDHCSQLESESTSAAASSSYPLPQHGARVFCNRELRLDHVKVVGFDYDYTLASYKLELQDLIYTQAKRYLMERCRYPAELEGKTYDRSFPIRGLVFDRQRGTLLKLSYAQAISPDTAFLGRRRLGRDELRGMYGEGLHVPLEFVKSDMKVLNDLFALSEACLLADVVQLAVDAEIPFDPSALGDDVSKAIQWVHMSGVMHDTVAANPDQYLHPSPALAALLGEARSSGKKVRACHLRRAARAALLWASRPVLVLSRSPACMCRNSFSRGLRLRWRLDSPQLFLLTNSALGFVEQGMRFLVGREWCVERR